MDDNLLGGLSTRRFLRDYWQKKPLLIRGAIPGFRNLLEPEALFELTARDDCESRLIRGAGRRWSVEHGPLDPAQLRRMPPSRWTILVQGLNTLLPAADALLRRFAFVPFARLDDLMVSYAVKDGGVGPHVDSYDVFLLQGEGRRRWRISAQKDLELVDGAPLKLLRDFRAGQEWVLEAGDMLYLPPQIAHEGTALDECMTYSIGFRAPAAQELAENFLAFMQERLELRGRYADPHLRMQPDPARLSQDLIAGAAGLLSGLKWTRADIAAFLGCYLSEPKAHIRYERPARPLSRPAFERQLARRPLALALASLLLYRGGDFYLNGEHNPAPPAWRKALRVLANDRRLAARDDLPGDLVDLFYDWYRAGYVVLE
jgi:50S ribosomal protein L16 3-hydroxylase